MPEVSSSISTPELLVLPVTHGDTDYLSWLTHLYADPATLQHFRFCRIIRAPGRSQFVPADQAFAFDFQQTNMTLI